MTEKRFTFHHDVDGIDYIEDKSNGFCLICDELMCSLLNELHEENIRLKRDFDSCSHNWALMYDEAKEKVEELSKENKIFREALKELKEIGDYQADRIKELNEENQDLKKQMKRLYNYFEDFFSEEMGNNDFSEMWDFVAEDEKWD